MSVSYPSHVPDNIAGTGIETEGMFWPQRTNAMTIGH